MLFNSRVTVRVRIGFSVWSVGDYADVCILLCIVVVPYYFQFSHDFIVKHPLVQCLFMLLLVFQPVLYFAIACILSFVFQTDFSCFIVFVFCVQFMRNVAKCNFQILVDLH